MQENAQIRPARTKLQIVFLALAVVYTPYILVFVSAEWSWTLIEIWPLFPGLALSALGAKDVFAPFSGTVLFAGIALLAARYLKRLVWPMMVMISLLSLWLTQVIIALLKA